MNRLLNNSAAVNELSSYNLSQSNLLGSTTQRVVSWFSKAFCNWLGQFLRFASFALITTSIIQAQPCHCTDPNAIVIGAPGVTTNLTTAIAQGLLAPMPNAATTAQQICIRGILNVNTNYTFSSSEINMDADASIEVSGFLGALKIQKNTKVYGCTQMWKRIMVSPLSTLSIISSTIRDGKEAVYAHGGSTLTLINNTFKNNYLGITVIGPLEIYVPSPITANTFIQEGNLLPPYAGELSYAGIKLSNVPGFTVGTANAGAFPNTFKSLLNGIVATKTTLYVHNCIFDIWGGYSVGNENAGDAISIADKSSLIATNNKFQDCSTCVQSKNSSIRIENNRIENYQNLNKIGGAGVLVNGVDNGFVRIVNNFINASKAGVVIINAINNSTVLVSNNSIYVGHPDINSFYNTGGGISIIGSSFAQSNPAIVEKNFVEMSGGGIGSTAAIRFWDSSVGKIINNQVKLIPSEDLASFDKSQGILVLGSKNSILISKNSVVGTMPSSGPVYSRGFYHNSSEGVIYCCNSVQGTDDGMTVTGTSLLTDFIWTIFNGSLEADLRYTSSGLTGEIGRNDAINPFNPNNRWQEESGIAVHESSSPDFIFLSRHYSKPFAPPTLPPIIQTPNSLNANWFTPGIEDESEACPTALDCGFLILPNEEVVEEIDTRIAKQNWDSETMFQPTLQWRAERYLLSKLKRNPELIDDNSFVQAFYGNMQETTVDLFNEIEREIELLDTVAANQTALYRVNLDTIFSRQVAIAIVDSLIWDADTLDLPALEAEKYGLVGEIADLMLENDSLYAIIIASRSFASQAIIVQNDSIISTEIYEQNEQIANDIFLHTVVQGNDTLTLEQFNHLDDIVWQCPLMGGNAVFKARTLYLMKVDTVFDDEMVCEELEERSTFKNSNTPSQKFQLYPNPASQSITVALGENFKTSAALLITNIYGEKVFQSKILAGQSKFVFPVYDIPSGIYFCRVYGDEEEVFSAKLLIIH